MTPKKTTPANKRYEYSPEFARKAQEVATKNLLAYMKQKKALEETRGTQEETETNT